jgi:hypothetical protein
MRTRWLPALGLGALAPVCAEYLWAYDDSTGQALVLIGSLLVFTPLYGCPALLVREVARRRGLGWLSILLLAAAFGVVEAGVVDQSMWSTDYRDIPYWHAMAAPTYVAPIGMSVFLVVTFVGGHVITSIGAPIAVVEGLAGRRGQQPWLTRWTIPLVAALYVAASALVLGDHLANESDHASAGQVAGSATAALLLVLLAVAPVWRPRPVRPGPVPSPWLVLVVAGGAFAATQLYGASPLGTDALLATEAVAVLVVWRLSARAGWGPRHAAALAAGALVGAGVLAFGAHPLGDVSAARQLGHNVTLLLLVAVLGTVALRRATAR